MLSQKEYLNLAKMAIRHYGNKNMLRDDEAIGEVANYIIRADIRYDASKGMNENSWRMLNGKYGVLIFLNNKKKQKKHLSLREIELVGSNSLMETVYVNEVFDIVDDLPNLSKRDRDMFKDRWLDKMTLREIAKKHKLTHERIRQILEVVYKKVREEYENKD